MTIRRHVRKFRKRWVCNWQMKWRRSYEYKQRRTRKSQRKRRKMDYLVVGWLRVFWADQTNRRNLLHLSKLKWTRTHRRKLKIHYRFKKCRRRWSFKILWTLRKINGWTQCYWTRWPRIQEYRSFSPTLNICRPSHECRLTLRKRWSSTRTTLSSCQSSRNSAK